MVIANYNGATGSAVSVAVNFAPLDHFEFSSVGTQAAGMPFNIIITAKDASNNTITNYVGTNTLNVSTGTISPISTGVFSSWCLDRFGDSDWCRFRSYATSQPVRVCLEQATSLLLILELLTISLLLLSVVLRLLVLLSA